MPALRPSGAALMPWPTDKARATTVPGVFPSEVRLVLEAAGLPELFGVTDAAEEYGVGTNNLDRIAGLPDPVYGPDLDPPYRLRVGRLWLADDIREHAKARREG